ncbi:MAG: 50S ribosomal protein L18 [Candidatus Buchananbacteria bacterium]|nr:50S ribosomal protein L18 [Candidatus Buchananbacteria bacterium]
MANQQIIKQAKRIRRKIRVKSKIFGTASQPRLSVNRSLGHIYAQIIDDSIGKTIVSASDYEVKETKGKNKTDIALAVGEIIAKKALAAKIQKVVFDRSSYKYHGRVKALAEGAKKGGLIF